MSESLYLCRSITPQKSIRNNTCLRLLCVQKTTSYRRRGGGACLRRSTYGVCTIQALCNTYQIQRAVNQNRGVSGRKCTYTLSLFMVMRYILRPNTSVCSVRFDKLHNYQYKIQPLHVKKLNEEERTSVEDPSSAAFSN
jgi:hypothetical protein